MFSFRVALLALMAASLSPHALAQRAAAPDQDSATVGLAVAVAPTYAGASRHRVSALPLLDYQWANGWFAGTRNGIGYAASITPELQLGARLGVDFGRKARRDRALTGLGDIDTQAELGLFARYALTPALTLEAELRRGAGDDGKGLLAELGGRYSLALSPRWRIGIGATATWANADYLQSFHGISAAQSARSGYAVYRPEAGLRDLRAALSLTHVIDANFAVTASLNASRLMGDAASSPLTQKRHGGSALLAVAYRF